MLCRRGFVFHVVLSPLGITNGHYYLYIILRILTNNETEFQKKIVCKRTEGVMAPPVILRDCTIQSTIMNFEILMFDTVAKHVIVLCFA